MKKFHILKNSLLASRRLALAAAVCAAVASPGAARAENKVLNGEFDNSAFAPNPGESAAAKVSAITGWSLSGSSSTYVNGVWVGPSGTTSHWLLLGGTMTQTLTNLSAGTYTFSFDWFRRRSNAGGGGEEMAYQVTGPGGLSVTGNTTGNQTPSVWNTKSQTVTLTSAGDVTLSFAVSGADYGIGMDNMVFSGPGAGGNKVVNGNLETNAALAPNAGDTASTMIPGGITDWSLSLSGGTTNYVNGQWVGPSGTTGHWLLLQGVMTQTITNVPAGEYAFSFDWFRRRSNAGGGGEEMAYQVTGPGGLSVTGNTAGNQTPSVWNTKSQTVTLTSAGDVTLSFTVSGNDWGIGIDKVALAPPPGPQANITSFTFPTHGVATITGTNITKSVPNGTSVTALSPTFTLSAGATCDPASGTTRNFSSPLHYLVTASDNTTKDYTVTVTVRPPGPPVGGFTRWFDASALGLADNAAVTQWNDGSDNTANATVPSGNATPVYVANAGTGSGLGAIHFAGNPYDADNSPALSFTRDTNIRTVFSVFKGSSFLLTDSDAYNFHRPSDDNPADPLIANYDADAIVNGQTYVNTVLVNPENTPMPTDVHNGFNLVEVLTDGGAVNANSFNKDRGYHSGDQYQAEVIIYDRVLTEEERLAVETYLTAKWFASGVTPPTTYDTWSTAKGLTGLTGSSTDPAKSADPDGDGKNNLYEFAFDGDPLSGVDEGKIVGKIATLGGDQVMTLTLPVRTGATFSADSGDLVSAAIDGIIYRIEGAVDLSTFNDSIEEVTPAITEGLPALSSGWSYRTFRRSIDTVTTLPTAFLRAKVTE